jgi:hypothetical protein
VPFLGIKEIIAQASLFKILVRGDENYVLNTLLKINITLHQAGY